MFLTPCPYGRNKEMIWMARRRPLRMTLSGLIIMSLLLSFFASLYFFLVAIGLFLAHRQTPTLITKCPRCKKNNLIEPWVISYSCQSCLASLTKEKEGWSRLKKESRT
jgi:phage FluMu protein Com